MLARKTLLLAALPPDRLTHIKTGFIRLLRDQDTAAVEISGGVGGKTRALRWHGGRFAHFTADKASHRVWPEPYCLPLDFGGSRSRVIDQTVRNTHSRSQTSSLANW